MLFAAAVAIAAAGLADRFADRTGMGEALTGTILLGLITALPGLVASVLAAVDRRDLFLVSIAILLNVIFLMGLIDRQKRGPVNIGIESAAMLAIYVGGFLILSLLM